MRPPPRHNTVTAPGRPELCLPRACAGYTLDYAVNSDLEDHPELQNPVPPPHERGVVLGDPVRQQVAEPTGRGLGDLKNEGGAILNQVEERHGDLYAGGRQRG